MTTDSIFSGEREIAIDRRAGTLTHGNETVPLAGAVARVESSGHIDQRVAAPRWILTGPLSFGLRKQKDDRKIYLTIEGPTFGWLTVVDHKSEGAARAFAVRLNALASAVPPVS